MEDRVLIEGVEGMMGRRETRKRLTNPASKMASLEMADLSLADESFHRPFHDAFQINRVIWPEKECVEKLLFFKKNGLGQHYRVIHKKEATEEITTMASQTMRQFYGQENLQYICFYPQGNRK